MSRFWEIVFCVPLLLRRHVYFSNLKQAPSRKLPLTALKTVLSHLKLPILQKRPYNHGSSPERLTVALHMHKSRSTECMHSSWIFLHLIILQRVKLKTMQWLPGQIILHPRWKLDPNPQDHFQESSSNCCSIQNPKQYAKIATTKTKNKRSSSVHSTFIEESVAKKEHWRRSTSVGKQQHVQKPITIQRSARCVKIESAREGSGVNIHL